MNCTTVFTYADVCTISSRFAVQDVPGNFCLFRRREILFEVCRIKTPENILDGGLVYCKIELPKVANGNWRMLHLQIGESCKAFARSAQERCSA